MSIFVSGISGPRSTIRCCGKYNNYEFPVKMSETPPNTKWSVRPVGFDNEFVMKKYLGKNDDEIRKLYEAGALGKWKDMQGRRPPPDWDGKAGLRT